ncbi:Uncharacterized protein Rs2_25941 [Raphanus sativus]|nr:Uncharacterized protein Rs2_25941 [Raphanus sativus]
MEPTPALLAPARNKNATDTVKTNSHQVAPPPYTAKGYLKKQAPKGPDVKGAKVSRKLRGRNSPRKRANPGIPPTVSARAVPRNEVFPSAISKKIFVSFKFGGVPETTQ